MTRPFAILVVLALSGCTNQAAATMTAHVERTGNFRGSTVSASMDDGMVAVMFQPPLTPDNATLIAASHDALSMYFDVDAKSADWRPIRSLSLRFETEPQPFDVTPVKDDAGLLAGLVITQP